MKKPEDFLFKLIHSLDKSERRYFKLYAKNLGAKSNNYIELFDIISKQETYDEAKLKLKFKNRKFTTHLSSNKQYLFNLILKAMRSYKTSNSVESQLLESLQNFNFLMEKGLLEILKKEIVRAEALARKYDNIHLIPRILSWKNTIKSLSLDKTYDVELLEEEIQEWLGSVDYLRDCILLKTEKKRSSYYWSKSKRQTSIVEIPLPPKNKISLRITYYMYKRSLAYQQHDDMACLQLGETVYELFDSYPHLFKDIGMFNIYVGALSNSIDQSSYLPLVKEFNDLSIRFDRLDQAKIPRKSMLYNFSCRLRFYKQVGDTDLGLATFKNFQQFVADNEGLMHHRSIPIVYYEVGGIYFVKGDFDKALHYFNKSIDIIKDQKTYSSLYYSLRLMEIMCFYEKEEDLLLESMIRSFRRKITSSDEFYPLAKIFIKLLTQLFLHATDKRHCTKALSEAHVEITELKASPLAHLFYYFPYEEWVISKQKLISLKTVLHQKYSTNG